MAKNLITISVDEYRELLISDSILTILQDNGVDNWEGYQYNTEEIEKQVDEIIEKKKA